MPDAEAGFVLGRLVFSVLNKTYAFESYNKTIGHEVSIAQSKGPFLDFHAIWSLEVIDENKTKVRFQTTFTLPFALNIMDTQSLIEQLGHTFIHAFAPQL